ncbi:olfactory receptor 14C36-like [Alligator sinensis]|uniref:Olfactory receptor n=1 Tax=Alligator sinensis TaxID=38654 RepID=A0A3Q0FME1_ALLSI|nr:olfactory receptor 14C36-like [Alligator sinensis]
MTNQTTVMEFLLLGFSDSRELQILHFMIFLLIYLATLIGNMLIIVALLVDPNLHTPMHFFLGNLSFIDLCYISVTTPKSMVNAITNIRSISFYGCITQLFLVICFMSAELAFLTVMAYDRYIAICQPLRYRLIMSNSTCLQLTVVCWIGSVIYSAFLTGDTFRLHFCGSNIISHFFCDIPQLLKLSCTDTHANEIMLFVCCSVFGSIFIASIFVSYIHIFITVLKMPSVRGKYKTLSTCLPHLTVFSLFMSTTMLTYMRPSLVHSDYHSLIDAVLYSVVPPLINPIIYSLRNKEIKNVDAFSYRGMSLMHMPTAQHQELFATMKGNPCLFILLLLEEMFLRENSAKWKDNVSYSRTLESCVFKVIIQVTEHLQRTQ